MNDRRLSTRVSAMLLILLLLLGDSPTLAASTALTTKAASLFKSASTGSKRLLSIAAGKKVSVISSKGKWKKVKVDGKVGFMTAAAFKSQLVVAQPTVKPQNTAKPAKKPKPTKKPKATKKPQVTAAPTPPPIQALSAEPLTLVTQVQNKALSMITQESAKLYQKAKTSSKYTTVPKGASVTIRSQNGKWSKVKVNGKAGYMLSASFQMTIRQKTKLYQKNSTSARYATIAKGKKVSILSQMGDWIKVRYNKKTGYLLPDAFEEPTPEPTPVPVPDETTQEAPLKTLRSGSSGDAVRRLQLRLEELGFLDMVPSATYGSGTIAAVKLFQSAANIKKTGKADSKTQLAAYSAAAPKSSILSASLKKGSKGTHVKRLQNRLKAKGYYKARISGSFNEATLVAIKAFQKQAGLSQDGVAGSTTLGRLFSPTAPSASATPIATAPPESTPSTTPAPTASANAAKPPPNNAEKKRKANIVINAAMAQLGKPYVYGSTGMNSFDCSGFTLYAYKQIGINLPHSAYSQGYTCGMKIGKSQLVRGDLVCWNTVSDGDLVDHVGIYLGNNQAIHASSGTGKVIISPIDSGYYDRVFSWGRALF